MLVFDLTLALTVLLGAIVGLMLTLSGAGGGIIAVPLLVFFLHLDIQQAAPIGLFSVGLAGAMGAFLAFREDQLRYRAASLIGLFGILTAPIGVWLAHQLPSQPLLIGFSTILIWLAIKTLRKTRRSHQKKLSTRQDKACQINPDTGRFAWNKPCAMALAATGSLSGFLSGLLGVGGGFVIIPALNRYSNLHHHSAIATTMGVIALVALSGILASAAHGSLNIGIMMPFALGAITGVLLGKPLAARAPARRLQKNFALMCLISAGLLIFQSFWKFNG